MLSIMSSIAAATSTSAAPCRFPCYRRLAVKFPSTRHTCNDRMCPISDIRYDLVCFCVWTEFTLQSSIVCRRRAARRTGRFCLTKQSAADASPRCNYLDRPIEFCVAKQGKVVVCSPKCQCCPIVLLIHGE